jgi:hypothetical protein
MPRHSPELEVSSRDSGGLLGERVKTEYVTGERYDAWDVHTDKQRWWVLTNLTNLYPQAQFQSLDYTLSFHIGLMHRLRTRQQRERGHEPDAFEEVYADATKSPI